MATPAVAALLLAAIPAGAVQVSITAVQPNASEAGATPGVVQVTRVGDTSTNLTVNLSISGTAAAAVDYLPLSPTVTIPAGVTTFNVQITPVDDAIQEANETVIVTVVAGAGYTVGFPSAATVTIVDNDGLIPTVLVTATDPVAAEAGADPGIFTITRAGDTSVALAVNVMYFGLANEGADYTVSPAGTTLTMASGQTSLTVTVTPIDDAIFEGDETVTLMLQPGSQYVLTSFISDTVTIVDNDGTPPTVSISVVDPDAFETGADPAVVRISRTGSALLALDVDIVLTGDATPGADYIHPGATVTIPAGQVAATVTIVPIDDALAENVESVTVTLVSGPGYTVSPTAGSALVFLFDNDGGGGVVGGWTYETTEECGAPTGRAASPAQRLGALLPYLALLLLLVWRVRRV